MHQKHGWFGLCPCAPDHCGRLHRSQTLAGIQCTLSRRGTSRSRNKGETKHWVKC